MVKTEVTALVCKLWIVALFYVIINFSLQHTKIRQTILHFLLRKSIVAQDFCVILGFQLGCDSYRYCILYDASWVVVKPAHVPSPIFSVKFFFGRNFYPKFQIFRGCQHSSICCYRRRTFWNFCHLLRPRRFPSHRLKVKSYNKFI